jgi:hypothetical protein
MLLPTIADAGPISTEAVEMSPGQDRSIDAKDENVIDAELGSNGEGSEPNINDQVVAAPGSDEPMDIEENETTNGPHVADESADELDPPVKKMKDLDIGSDLPPRRTPRAPPPPGREISDPTLEFYKNQHQDQASSSRTEKAVSEPEPVKPVPAKQADRNILNSQR